jgi:hypothetical protein
VLCVSCCLMIICINRGNADQIIYRCCCHQYFVRSVFAFVGRSLVRRVADSLAGSLTRPLATWAERVEWVGNLG